MKLNFTCSIWNEKNKFRPIAPNRGELQMKMGDDVNVNCVQCGSLEKKHLNDIYAVVDYRIILVGVILGIIVTVPLWMYYGAIAAVSGMIPILIYGYENKTGHAFNYYRIKRK
ncbi:MAG: hypothetical protein KJO05_08405 [Bacteroidia bacterium]|nr:hypothetical protein [Bacteroidia bacterium]NNF31563.1 hypothetical protein [Flavobacteriaceae bacterium]MBT8275638.1 hypothetical protein [Bacteroidia bacterium]NNJ82393.1 hypothetical protein [Flavobacteriaceae bacterium]NNK54142.1 hypothetical protein [Flavobacteriaceae bacterium]